ncbi:allantoinase-like [Durio zibethinus]|uniref:Allantoinase-like n=1 Tax=Durio zibethinus TaxID=66656 RepID=A0A6P5WF10_DURZI|nr:allantoinase-like [Durio zibethinus]
MDKFDGLSALNSLSSEEIPDRDTHFKCAPPICDAANKEKLWNALMEGHIDMLSSDHSLTVPELKLLNNGNFLRAWGGISSVQVGDFPFSEKLSEVTVYFLLLKFGETTLICYMLLCSFTFRKRYLEECGDRADIVIWEPEVEFDLNADHPMYVKNPACIWMPYISGKVLATVVRGNLVYKEGNHASADTGALILAA